MGAITNPLLLKVLSNNDRMLYGERKGLKLGYNDYHGCCTSGPTGWYAQADISLRWWNSARPVTFNNSRSKLEGCGMIPVWHGTLSEIDQLTAKHLRPGDVATLYQGYKLRKSQHGMMWTGHDWRSDCIQRHANCEKESDQGNYSAVIWRHPKLQQAEWGDIHNMNGGPGSVNMSDSYNGSCDLNIGGNNYLVCDSLGDNQIITTGAYKCLLERDDQPTNIIMKQLSSIYCEILKSTILDDAYGTMDTYHKTKTNPKDIIPQDILHTNDVTYINHLTESDASIDESIAKRFLVKVTDGVNVVMGFGSPDAIMNLQNGTTNIYMNGSESGYNVTPGNINVSGNAAVNKQAFSNVLQNYSSVLGLNQLGMCLIMGQVMHESGNFKYMAEIGAGKGRKYGKPDGPYGKIYYGRGPVQVTWYSNYKKIYNDFFVPNGLAQYDVVKNPDIALDPTIGSLLTLGWFLTTSNGKRAREAANRGDVVACTKAINGGTNGLADRKSKTLALCPDYNISPSQLKM